MRASFFRGTGVASSSTRRTSGGPYRVQTTAFTLQSPLSLRIRVPLLPRQACSGVDDLHTPDQEPQCQPEFRDEAQGERW